jgi:hypothetical protein
VVDEHGLDRAGVGRAPRPAPPHSARLTIDGAAALAEKKPATPVTPRFAALRTAVSARAAAVAVPVVLMNSSLAPRSLSEVRYWTSSAPPVHTGFDARVAVASRLPGSGASATSAVASAQSLHLPPSVRTRTSTSVWASPPLQRTPTTSKRFGA